MWVHVRGHFQVPSARFRTVYCAIASLSYANEHDLLIGTAALLPIPKVDPTVMYTLRGNVSDYISDHICMCSDKM